MADFSIATSATEAVVLGLVTGPVCLASCGPIVLPWMLVQPQGIRVHARQMSLFLAARLAGYLLFASAIWSAGSLLAHTSLERSWIFGAIQLLLAVGLLFYAAASPRAHCAVAPTQPPDLVQIRSTPEQTPPPRKAGAVTLGFLTGINLCPPFLVAGVRAAQMSSMAGALLFFTVFFAGTAVWFAPFLTFGVMRRTPSFLTVARMVAVLLACWYGFTGASLLIQKAIYG
jgi:sulfite exporter TauE/SafE